MAALALAFFVTALLYASVGFGGGSTYTALLALAEVDYRLLPLLSLACNLVVVTGSSVRFGRAGITPWRGAILLTGLAAPAAFIGGLTPIGEAGFLALLGGSLVFTALSMLLPVAGGDPARPTRLARPLLHLVRWNDARAIAATASLFILVNSLFGLAGQVVKNGPGRLGAAVELGLPLLVAVAVAGQVGSLLALKYLPQRWIHWGTAALTAWVGGRLLLNL